jgi:tripartite-type tricarboxylate transporter receptor subunit TctC
MLKILLPSALLALSASFLAQAQGFPTKPIIVVNQQIAGGPSDVTMRVVQRLRDELVKAVTHPDVVNNMSEQGIVTMTSASPAEFSAFIAAEVPRLGRAVKLSGAKVE